MTEHWQRTMVIGYGPEAKGMESQAEEVLHRRGQDPFVMAMRRNNALAACCSFSVRTVEAFTQVRTDDGGRRDRDEIPKEQGNRFEEWDW